MVVFCALATGSRQDFISTPSTNTEHVPHSPAPQPSLLPVRLRSSRMKSSRRWCGLAARETLRPLIVALNCRSGIRRLQFGAEHRRVGAGAPRGVDQATQHKTAHHFAAILLTGTRSDKR